MLQGGGSAEYGQIPHFYIFFGPFPKECLKVLGGEGVRQIQPVLILSSFLRPSHTSNVSFPNDPVATS